MAQTNVLLIICDQLRAIPHVPNKPNRFATPGVRFLHHRNVSECFPNQMKK